MTSPDLIRELQASRPAAPEALRSRVREIAAPTREPARRRRPRFALPRPAFVLLPAAAAVVLAVGVAGVIGLARSGGPASESQRAQALAHADSPSPRPSPSPGVRETPHVAVGSAATVPSDLSVAPTPGRAQQVDATLTVKVTDSDHVSSAAQDALDLTRSLGGHVQSASVTTGDQAQATLTLRVPVDRAEEAVAKLSALGVIVSQQVSIQDLQEQLDSLVLRARSVRAQIVQITARLESRQLTPEQRAALELRRRNLRSELRALRQEIRSTHSQASFATVQLSVVTPQSLGVVPTRSRLDRALDRAVEVLVWEGIAALVVLLVLAPLVLLALAAVVARRFWRRHEEDRLLATS